MVLGSMLRRMLRRPTHATVVAYLALFMAMSGTAYAAVQWTGANIQDGSLTGADIASGSIPSGDLAPGGGSAGGTLLGQASNRATVTGPMYSTDPASVAQTVAPVTFTVPAGHSYQVLVAVPGVVNETFSRYEDTSPFGLEQSMFAEFATAQFGKRYDRIARSRGLTLAEVDALAEDEPVASGA